MACNDSISLIVETLNKERTPLLAVPTDAEYVYPVSFFPPLSKFDISLQCPAIVVPARRTAEYLKKLKNVLLNRPKAKVVVQLSGSGEAVEDRQHYRKILLENRSDVLASTLVQELLETKECFIGNHELTQSYEDWTTHEVLRRILPVDSGEVPSAFEQIGHLAHINLRRELIPFKYIIGKVLLDKNSPRIQTVVNKLGSIKSEFRTFGMEVIAGKRGEGWSKVTVKEEGSAFTMDFRLVYWNSRLGGEHRRLTDIIFQDAEHTSAPVVVADFMAGIGPFAVPLSSKGYNTQVHANDLNPASYEYLAINARKNRCQKITCYNMDARSFCHQLQDREVEIHHVIMNLPASAPEFLDAFRGFTGKALPLVHVHCFASKDYKEAEQASVARCQSALGCELEKHLVTFVDVRNVSPQKNMYCISFRLPAAVRQVPRIDSNNSNLLPDAKRARLN